MKEKVILLVEDNPDEELLALRALAKASVTNNVIVARDGVGALDYLFGTGAWIDRGSKAFAFHFGCRRCVYHKQLCTTLVHF